MALSYAFFAFRHPELWLSQGKPERFFDFVYWVSAATCLAIEVHAQFGMDKGHGVLGREGRARLAEFSRRYHRLLSATLAAFFICVAYLVMKGGGPGCVLLPLIVLAGVTTLYPMVNLGSLLRDLKAAGELPPGYTPLFYWNPGDPRVWVPKLLGRGTTLNLARRPAWLWLIFVVGSLLTGVWMVREFN